MVRIISFILFAVFTVDIFFHGISPENDIKKFAFFNEYLQPKEATIAYIRYVRQRNQDRKKSDRQQLPRIHSV